MYAGVCYMFVACQNGNKTKQEVGEGSILQAQEIAVYKT